MTHHDHTFPEAIPATREHELAVLADDRRALYAAKVTRMAKRAIEWANSPHDDLAKLSFLDAAAHCIDSDLADETDNLLRDLGLDSEGYPTDTYGDRDLRADRVWLPVELAA